MLVLLTVIISMYNQEEKELYCPLRTFCLQAYGSSGTQYAKSEVNFGVLFGDLNVLSFARISRWKWIVHVNRMDSKRKVSQVFNNNPGSGLRGPPKNRGWNCVPQKLINSKLKTKKRGKRKQS
jgi:hypothetical protein